MVSKIKSVTQFPGKKIGGVDNGVSSKPLFYGMVVTTSPFVIKMFGGIADGITGLMS